MAGFLVFGRGLVRVPVSGRPGAPSSSFLSAINSNNTVTSFNETASYRSIWVNGGSGKGVERNIFDPSRFMASINNVNPLDIQRIDPFYRDAESPAVIRINPELPQGQKKSARRLNRRALLRIATR